MGTITISAVLDILVRLVTVAPSLADAYKRIVNSLKQTGEITVDEWEKRKAEYLTAMNGDAWTPDPPTE